GAVAASRSRPRRESSVRFSAHPARLPFRLAPRDRLPCAGSEGSARLSSECEPCAFADAEGTRLPRRLSGLPERLWGAAGDPATRTGRMVRLPRAAIERSSNQRTGVGRQHQSRDREPPIDLCAPRGDGVLPFALERLPRLPY